MPTDTTTASISCPLPLCGWRYDQFYGPTDRLPVTDGRGAPPAFQAVPPAGEALTEHLGTHDPALWAQAVIDAQGERDQHAAASRHLARRIREVAGAWATQLPETVRTAAVVEVLMGIASHVPDRPHLRDDLWMRIVGACEARFENDGHPEDARAAADEAMSVVQPVLDELRAERGRLTVWLRGRLPESHRALEAAMELLRETCASYNAGDEYGKMFVPGLSRAVEVVHRVMLEGHDGPSADDDPERAPDDAAAALARVVAECDRIERAIHDQPTSPDFDGAYLAALGHVRRAITGPQPEVDVQPGDGAWGAMWLHSNWRSLTGRMATEEREHAAAAVLRWMHALDVADGRPAREEPRELRWWRTP
jgi:hypothetical protein